MPATILLGGQIDKLPGSRDDGTSDGILRTKVDQGPLVPMLVRDRGVVLTNVGSATSASTSTSIDTANFGLPGGFQLTTPAGTGGSVTRIATRAYGRRFGALISGQASGSPGEFDVLIDAMLVFSGSAVVRHRGVAVSTSEGHWTLPLIDDLPDDGPHLIEIVTWADPSSSSTITVLDLLGEQRFYGGLTPRRVGLHQTAITFTNANGTTRQSVPVGGHKNTRILRFTNTDTVVVNMILDDGTTDIRGIAVPAQSGNLPGYTEVDLGDYAAVSGWRLRCDVAPTSGKTITVRSFTGN